MSRAILDGLHSGTRNNEVLADLAGGGSGPRPPLREALNRQFRRVCAARLALQTANPEWMSASPSGSETVTTPREVRTRPLERSEAMARVTTSRELPTESAS